MTQLRQVVTGQQVPSIMLDGGVLLDLGKRVSVVWNFWIPIAERNKCFYHYKHIKNKKQEKNIDDTHKVELGEQEQSKT